MTMMNKALLHRRESLSEQYETYFHKSGLTIHVFPKKMSTTFAIIGTRYGSLDRSFRVDGETDFLTVPDGIAHFLEHKMFETEDGTDAFEQFAEVGANANAYTSNDVTAYLFSCTDHFREALEILLRCVTTPFFTDENIRKEMGIIGQEIRMYEDNPSTRLYYLLLECLYAVHPVRINVAGTTESIAQIDKDLLYRCYRAFYQPSNMTLVVCGDVCAEEVLDVADRVLHVSAQRNVEKAFPDEPAGIVCAKKTCEMAVSRPLVAIGIKDDDVIRDPVLRERRGICLDIVNDLLFGKSGALYSRLYDDGLISDDFSADYELLSSCAFNMIACECDNPERVLSEVKNCVADALKNPPSQEDFERIRRCNYADYIRGFDSTEEIANELLTQDLRGVELFAEGDLLEAITYDEVCRVMREFYQNKEFAMAVICPCNSEKE